MNFVFNYDEFCIQYDGFCIENDDEFEWKYQGHDRQGQYAHLFDPSMYTNLH